MVSPTKDMTLLLPTYNEAEKLPLVCEKVVRGLKE